MVELIFLSLSDSNTMNWKSPIDNKMNSFFIDALDLSKTNFTVNSDIEKSTLVLTRGTCCSPFDIAVSSIRS